MALYNLLFGKKELLTSSSCGIRSVSTTFIFMRIGRDRKIKSVVFDTNMFGKTSFDQLEMEVFLEIFDY